MEFKPGKDHPKYRHGMSSHSSSSLLYKKWCGMKRRCLNPKDTAYARYGGAGVTISEEWMDFVNFLEDMGPSYFVGASIDRIDNDKGYSKENCRWVTMAEQNRHKATVRLYMYSGEMLTIPQIAQKIEMKPKTLYSRLVRQNMPLAQAITKPI